MNKDSKIYIAGHRGLVGSAILKNLKAKGFENFVLRTHAELNLTNAAAVEQFFVEEKPEYVFLAAAKVGGIVANNKYRGDFIYENLMIQNNVIHQAYVHGVTKLLFLGSTCIYPKNAPQPMTEDALMMDKLEYTNEPYAIAKIAGIKMCENYNLQYGTNFISVMPTNLYGPNDNFNLETSHVLPALVRKIHLGKALENNDWQSIKNDLNARPIEGLNGEASKEEILKMLAKYGLNIQPAAALAGGDSDYEEELEVAVEIWGSGKPMREFLWSEDMADACVFLMENRDFKDTIEGHPELDSGSQLDQAEIRNTHINIGTGKEISIAHLAETIKEIIGFKGELVFNTSKPDGTMRKLTDPSKLHGLGWKHKVELEEGITSIYNWYKS
ncbi:GDP-L-fucose synthase family protein [Salegentibacter mishustinae]|uniref:GDP-L-fucose synthase n=1 Tax=Salegentibacter mishustinae TaxID=270918 RepID=A0A0Q9ZC56_9FLAO|nr:GDP-L-fucose synthase [Salegentibacter mishustinae]KRG30653.1 GDP-fucose synthetase [Salegentibacter mishustinae]PNW23541.1 GDP-fucose synthetase [Salegentibacter mishustinae]PZX66620.1 GDP-L-fucose synthase [Salegentibacter mishustinae]GGW83541.1 GDP-L-fucose synthase [Salegentibacter mishustinae]